MKQKKKLITVLCLALVTLAIVLSAICVGLRVRAEFSYGDAFDYTSSPAPIRYRTMQSDSDSPTRKGLLLFAYDNGASAEFRAEMNGSFAAGLKALKNGKSVDLTKYSLVFTDRKTGKSFSVTVANKGSYNDVYVSVDGNNAGIYYYTSQYDVNGTAYGYTALYNSSGSYTSVQSDEIRLAFDPETMQINVMGNGGAYHLVWDLSEEYNDGKQLRHDLPRFGDYTVKIVFDEVKSNGKGELLVYSFGGHLFDSASAENKPGVSANVAANAIVGQPYRIPESEAFDLFSGKLPGDDVSVTVYDVYGNVVVTSSGEFTPQAKGEYYICYSYQPRGAEKPSAVALYRILSLDPAEITYEFAYDSDSLADPKPIGSHRTVYIPAATVNSNLIVSGTADVFVTIRKGNEIVSGYDHVPGGFEYLFTDTGVYTIEYQITAFGTEMRDTKTVTVSADIPTFLVDEIPETVPLNASREIKPGKVYLGKDSFDMEVTVRYPSGKTVSGGECRLDELGIYKVTHAYGDKTYEQQFTVRQRYSDLFSGDSFSANFGTLSSNNTLHGQLLSLTNNNSVSFTRLIDLSDNTFNENLEDKSENTPLIEMFAQPHSVGITDVQGIYITLTDKYDPNNYIIIRIKYLSYLPNNMRIRTMASGQSWVGYDYDFWTGAISVDSAQSHEDGGTIVSFDCSQSATNSRFEDRKLRLYFDNTTGRLYTRTWQDKAGNSTETNYIPIPWLIRDYKTTDPTLSAGDTPWKGFTTGEVYLSVYATGVSDTADFLVTNIDGEDLSGEFYSDDVAPTISVDVDEADIPFARVGKEFSMFNYTASDVYSSIVEKSVKVYHSGKEISATDGKFTPQEVGIYTIVYTATDAFGNTATKKIDVEAKNSLPKLEIETDGSLPEDISFGQLVRIPAADAVGGAGGIRIDVKVTAVDADETVEIKNGAFTCLKQGKYRIEYVARDYIGNTVSRSIWFDVSFSTAPVFDEERIVLPYAFLAGETFLFNEYFATYYNGNGGMENVRATITVEDANGIHQLTDGKYTPVASDTDTVVKITFSFTANGQTLYVTRTVPVLSVKRGVGYLKYFFSATNGTVEAANDAVWFEPTGGSMTFAFARAIAQRYLVLNLKRDDVKPFTRMTVYLRDVSDPDAVVKLTYRNRLGRLTMSINDGPEYKANFDTNGNFSIKYDISTKRIMDVLGMEIGTITSYQNGAAFNGFPSGSVYMEIEADGKVGITTIANQNFNNYVRDSITPLLTINGSFSGTYLPGQTITLPSASAYDVLGPVGEIMVTVKSASGEVVASGNAKDAVSFVLQNYGTYSVVYTVTDASGNKMSYSSSLAVVDNVKPTLTFDGSVPETVKAGSSIKIPGYTVSDNGDLSRVVVKRYICGPDGMILAVGSDDMIRFSAKGEYILYFFVIDENNNSTNYAFRITAS